MDRTITLTEMEGAVLRGALEAIPFCVMREKGAACLAAYSSLLAKLTAAGENAAVIPGRIFYDGPGRLPTTSRRRGA